MGRDLGGEGEIERLRLTRRHGDTEWERFSTGLTAGLKRGLQMDRLPRATSVPGEDGCGRLMLMVWLYPLPLGGGRRKVES